MGKLDKLKRGTAYHTGQQVEKNENPQLRIDKVEKKIQKDNQTFTDNLTQLIGTKQDKLTIGKNEITTTLSSDVFNIREAELSVQDFYSAGLQTTAKWGGSAINELLTLIKAINPWIKGEYKWMPIGSTMPAGWTKVAIGVGETLVAGTTEGTTEGANKKIRFYGYDLNATYMAESYPYSSRPFIGSDTLHAGWKGGMRAFLSTAKPFHQYKVAGGGTIKKEYGTGGSVESLDANSPKNLAAGINAELWQYTG